MQKMNETSALGGLELWLHHLEWRFCDIRHALVCALCFVCDMDLNLADTNAQASAQAAGLMKKTGHFS
jgi:hypothetical protein